MSAKPVIPVFKAKWKFSMGGVACQLELAGCVKPVISEFDEKWKFYMGSLA
jgi:hypothetical protein